MSNKGTGANTINRRWCNAMMRQYLQILKIIECASHCSECFTENESFNVEVRLSCLEHKGCGKSPPPNEWFAWVLKEV